VISDNVGVFTFKECLVISDNVGVFTFKECLVISDNVVIFTFKECLVVSDDVWMFDPLSHHLQLGHHVAHVLVRISTRLPECWVLHINLRKKYHLLISSYLKCSLSAKN